MIKRNKNTAILDLGSSKVCCMIAEQDENEIIKVIGIGHYASSGIEKGIITDQNLAIKNISNAIKSAERMANVKIKSGVTLAMSSDKIFSKLVRGKISIINEKISEEDVRKCVEITLKDKFFIDKKVIHNIPLNYILDGADRIKDPIGMYANYLEIEFLISYLNISHFKNFINCVTQCDVDINKVINAGLASGLAILNDNEIFIGSAVVDMGARTTSLNLFSNNNLIFSESLAFGGHDITEQIARQFSISFKEAERLKIMHASVLENPDEIEMGMEIPSINFDNKDDYIKVTKGEIYDVVKPIIIQILNWISDTLKKSGKSNLVSKVLVFTGGASQIDGLPVLARDILNVNARVGTPKDLKINFQNSIDASYSVSAGLIKHNFENYKANFVDNISLQNEIGKSNTQFSIKNWFGQNFFN